jgi:hypothetical protein
MSSDHPGERDLPDNWHQLSDYEKEIFGNALNDNQIAILLEVISGDEIQKLGPELVVAVVREFPPDIIQQLDFEFINGMIAEETADINNELILDLSLSNRDEAIQEPIESLLGDLQSTTGWNGHEQRSLAAINVVLTNLIHTNNFNPGSQISYSRDVNRYSNIHRYNPYNIGFRPLMRVIDGLIELNLIRNFPGFYGGPQGVSRTARMRAMPELIWRISNYSGIQWTNIRATNSESIILKNSNKWFLDYPETNRTISMRAQIAGYNGTLSSAVIGISCDDPEVIPFLNSQTIDFTARQYHRVFNNSSFEQGGRFYGPWWLQLKSRDRRTGKNHKTRRFLTINDERVVSLDFKAIHLYMLYCMEDLNYIEIHDDSDPYLLPEYVLGHRDALKLASTILLGSVNLSTARGAISHHLRQEGLYYEGWDTDGFIDAFRDKHERIIHRVMEEHIALKLQYKDSLICEYVIDDLMSKNIPVLGIHDGYIVQESHEEELRNAMEGGYLSLGLSPSAPIEREE